MTPVDLHWQVLMMRERELQVAFAEYTFLSMCGGVNPEDVARLRANVTGILPPPVVVKIEDCPEDAVPASEIMPLKQMIKDLLVGVGPEGEGQLNALCRSVRQECGDAIKTYTRHHASYVRVDDKDKIRSALARVFRARMETFDDM